MKIHPRTIVVHVLAWGAGVIWFIPFLGVLMSSIRPTAEIARAGWWSLSPFTVTLDNFVLVLTNEIFPMLPAMGNSFLVVIPATAIPVIVGSLAGYGFARFSLPIRDYLFLFIVLLMAVPQMMVAIPIFGLMDDINLVNNLLGLIILHAAWGLPWIILFMRNFFGQLPVEIEEAARVDGAGDLRVFFRVVLPMALPALASLIVLQFMWVWSDFFFAQILVQDTSQFVATQIVPRVAIGAYHRDWGALTAAVLLVMLVPILVYTLLQKYYIRGMIGWTVKG
ncbi:MAG: carbohydrate ABC transporter permease [Thermoplasmata archaeon]